MRRQFYILIFLFSITAINCIAQQKSTAKPLQFQSINNVGLLEGRSGSAFQLQSINGVQYKSWFTGVGVGLDYYRLRTISLFIDLRKEFGKSANKLFVFADAGINFYWERDQDIKQFPVDDKFRNGFYTEVGAGYKIKLSRKLSMLISSSYSYKKITEDGNYYYFDPFDPPLGWLNANWPTQKINYNLSRLVLKTGIQF